MSLVTEVDAGNWKQEVLDSNLLTAVDFWRLGCSWCERLSPVLDQVVEQYRGRIKFVKLNVLANPENRQIAVRYGVMGTPTVIFFCEGRPAETFVGYTHKERFEVLLNRVLENHRDCVRQSTELNN